MTFLGRLRRFDLVVERVRSLQVMLDWRAEHTRFSQPWGLTKDDQIVGGQVRS
jgi:hypothetical protein